jgi:hypothetical protein
MKFIVFTFLSLFLWVGLKEFLKKPGEPSKGYYDPLFFYEKKGISEESPKIKFLKRVIIIICGIISQIILIIMFFY